MAAAVPWDSYAREARRLSGVCDQRLMSMQMLMQRHDSAGKDDFQALKADAEASLAELRHLNAGVDETAISQGERMQLYRFRDVYAECSAELKRAVRAYAAQQDREELLGTVHTALQDYSEQQQALDIEAEHIAHASREVDRLQAMAAQSHSSLQRAGVVLAKAQSRARELASSVPGIHGLLGRIHRKHQKDNIILGVVVAVCLFIIWISL